MELEMIEVPVFLVGVVIGFAGVRIFFWIRGLLA